jgi:hypothetical protein
MSNPEGAQAQLTACRPASGTATVSTTLIPVSQWSERHPWPPIGGLRHLIFNAKTNGFHQVIRRVGRRVLVDEAEFFAWVERQGTSAPRPVNQGASRTASGARS